MLDQRSEKDRDRRRGGALLGRGLLLALPVLVLSVFGLLSLRQDRKIVESEVRERAQAFANEAAERCWKRLNTISGLDTVRAPLDWVTGSRPVEGVLRVSTNGALVVPPPLQTVPAPVLADLAALNPEQAELWRLIEADRTAGAGPTNAIERLRAFLGTHPPAEAEARARFRLAMGLIPSDPQQARAELRTIIERFPESRGETGLPLSALAMMRLADISMAALERNPVEIRSILNLLASNAVAQPSLLTPWMLDRVSGWELGLLNETNLSTRWNRAWAGDERYRRIYAAIRRALSLPGPAEVSTSHRTSATSWPEILWFHHEEPMFPADTELVRIPQHADGLAVGLPRGGDGSRGYLCREPRQVLAVLREFAETEASLPDYLGVYYRIAGKTFAGSSRLDAHHPASQKAGDVGAPTEMPRDILAAASPRSGEGKDFLTVSVALLEPAKLYARQRQRIYWFGALIGLSVVVALLGFVSTWRAFERQQRLYEMQTNFISSVTHELRAPIGAVRLMTENLQRAKVRDPVEQRRVFDQIVQECARLSSMIENVLHLARIEQGRKGYEFEETDLHRLVADTVQLMAPHAAARQVTLEPRLAPASGSGAAEAATVDGRAVQQMLINLIDNAIKHAPAESAVRIGLDWGADGVETAVDKAGASGAPAGSRLRLWVADHGPGIPPEERAKIFDRFYRLGSELRRETPGVGIGLSIVKHVVQAHRGQVWVEDEAGGGCRFVVELPWIQSGDAARHPIKPTD